MRKVRLRRQMAAFLWQAVRHCRIRNSASRLTRYRADDRETAVWLPLDS